MQLYDLNGSRLQRTSGYGDAAWASALAWCHPSRFAAAPCCGRIRTSATDVFVKDYQHHFWVQTLCWQNYRNEILGHQGDCRKPRTGRSRLLTKLLCGRPSSPRYREQSLPSSPAETDSGTGAKAAQLCSTPGSRASLVAGEMLSRFFYFFYFLRESAPAAAHWSRRRPAGWPAPAPGPPTRTAAPAAPPAAPAPPSPPRPCLPPASREPDLALARCCRYRSPFGGSPGCCGQVILHW